ncbi:MAG: aldehyde dehydrogenase family protein, partial [Alphaproteobacteria bacterium]
MFINGEWRNAASAKTFDSLNPATGAVVGSVPDGGAADAVAAIDAATAAFPAWAGKTAYERSAILYKAWSLMVERKSELAKLMTTEQGKPLRAATNETQYAADFLLWYAEEAKRVYGETIPASRSDQRFII